MKTKNIFFALLIAGFFVVGNVMASGNLKLNIKGTGNDMAEVEILNAKTSMFEIKVMSEDGEILFYKETKAPANNYKRNYDFSRLEDGTYYFSVKIDNESTETKFDIKRGEVNILEEKKMLEPIFMFDNKQLKLTYLNFAEENTTLSVYDSNRNELYMKDLNSNFVNNHGLDLSKLVKGQYEVVLSNVNEFHSYTVLID